MSKLTAPLSNTPENRLKLIELVTDQNVCHDWKSNVIEMIVKEKPPFNKSLLPVYSCDWLAVCNECHLITLRDKIHKDYTEHLGCGGHFEGYEL